jgi:hypothetical protein
MSATAASSAQTIRGKKTFFFTPPFFFPPPQDAEKKRNEIDNEALALSLASTNALFLFFLVALTFFVLRNTQPTYNFVGRCATSVCGLTLLVYTAFSY